jgi:pimeloyl-ACP methyl ester carboxylesterase
MAGVCLSGYTHFSEFPGRNRLFESPRWPGPRLARLSPTLVRLVVRISLNHPGLYMREARQLVSEQDPFIPVDYARHLADNLPAADLTLMPDAGHLYPLAEQFQERLFQRLNRYLNNPHRKLQTAT